MKIKKKWVSWEEFNDFLSGGPVTGHTHLKSAITDTPWAWTDVSKTGSSLADLATRAHGNLSDAPSGAHHPQLHAAAHKSAGGDAIRIDELKIATDVTTLDATVTEHGLLPKLYGGTSRFLRADGAWVTPTADPNPHASDHELGGSDEVDHDALLNFVAGEHFLESSINHDNIANVTEDQHHSKIHAVSHKSAGGDSLRIDELKEGTDITTLDSSITRHGLLPKLYGGTVRFLRADGTWVVPSGGTPDPHASDHEVGGSDLVSHDALTDFAAGEHLALPNTIDNVLSDHTKAEHDALGIDHGSLAGKGDDDHTQYLLASGARVLSAAWDAGGYQIRALKFYADQATGTAPFTVVSTTKVVNLNVDRVDEIHGTSLIRSDTDDNVAGHTEWQDSKQVRLGNDADFRMWHDATNHYFRGYKHGANFYLQMENAGGTNKTYFFVDPDLDGCYVGDHSTTFARAQLVGVCYGTTTPPTANTTSRGSLFIKYTP